MRARFLWMWLLGSPALAMPVTYYEPGYGNAGPLILLGGGSPNVPGTISQGAGRFANNADATSASDFIVFDPRLFGFSTGRVDHFLKVALMGGLDFSKGALFTLPNNSLFGDARVHDDNLPPSVTLVHDHWINNRGYKDENGTHCCDHRANNGDCDEIPAESVKPTPDGQGYLTPKGRISNRSTYISEDGKTYLCGSTKPRCLFVPGGG